jgi:ubiquinone/menaquinone biosynthesis C-methylase UbiE
MINCPYPWGRYREQPHGCGKPARRRRASRICSSGQGDATDLAEQADKSFDLVVSIFGAMFAPRPNDVAKEMVRVTRPGGRIVMGNWIPNDPSLVAQILKISAAYSPPPPEGFVSPMLWGVESEVVARFESAGITREKCRRSVDLFI